MSIGVTNVSTNVFEGQKPGTSGLRKQVKVFQQPHYTENFVQSVLVGGLGDALKGACIVVGGDGRFLCKETSELIVKMAAANGVRSSHIRNSRQNVQLSRVLVGRNGFMSTPALSCVIRNGHGGRPINGGIILTASHNPGGKHGDFGIKYNCENGGPASDAVTDRIHALTTNMTTYRICNELDVDVTTVGERSYEIEGHGTFTVNVIDPVDAYNQLMQSIFDFAAIRQLLTNADKPFKLLVDSMHGATGPYVERILCDELGVPTSQCRRMNVLPDFGGCHPDPNLTYAADLVQEIRAGDSDMAVAFDGDGDRNMILGDKAFFVTPSDSLAILAANLECIPYFKRTGVKGFARSMPTAGAVDRVAEKLGKKVYETPTGWKYFGNLMDASSISLCGEESFGTGSDHIREKDGLWACLAWLSVLAHKRQSVRQITQDHWKVYGRNVFTRYDYEKCDAQSATMMMNYVEMTSPALVGTKLGVYTVQLADNFAYTDPVDGSQANKQGLRIIMTDGSRIVLRLSGTGSSGATVRLYIDSFIDDPAMIEKPAAQLLQPLIDVALEMAKIEQFVSRKAPTVIT